MDPPVFESVDDVCTYMHKLYGAIALPILLYHTETWSHMDKREIAEIEKIQKSILYQLHEIPASTTYQSFLSEVVMKKIETLIHIKKFMLLHQILTSDDDRLAKKVLLEQMNERIDKCWYTDIKQLAEIYQVNIDVSSVTSQMKNQWKTIVERPVKKQSQIWSKLKIRKLNVDSSTQKLKKNI